MFFEHICSGQATLNEKGLYEVQHFFKEREIPLRTVRHPFSVRLETLISLFHLDRCSLGSSNNCAPKLFLLSVSICNNDKFCASVDIKITKKIDTSVL